MNRAEKKTALITGGGQGIGKAIALDCLRRGYNVVIADTDREAGAETAEELGRYGSITFMQTDISNEAQVRSAISETISLYGGIYLLVNNAGFMIRKKVTDLTLDEWNRVIGTNLTGMFLCVKYAAASLREWKGVIINIASSRALMSEADTESYSASKGGAVALTHALSVSLGPDVRVNCISPGWIETGDWKKSRMRVSPKHSDQDRLQHPSGRVGIPDDIASMALFLADEKNSFITGQNFVIDGGMTKKMIYAE